MPSLAFVEEAVFFSSNKEIKKIRVKKIVKYLSAENNKIIYADFVSLAIIKMMNSILKLLLFRLFYVQRDVGNYSYF